MREKRNLKEQPQKKFSAVKPLLIGAALGLIVILIFVFRVSTPKVQSGKFWMVRPLITESIAGAIGALFFYFMNYMGSNGAINKTMALLLGVIVFILALWLGIIAGGDSTIWD
jgi:hypothetical protein